MLNARGSPAINVASIDVEFTALQFPERALIDRVCGELREMPGVRVSLQEAARLWSMDSRTCGSVLQYLGDAGFLVRDFQGRYRRAHAGY